MRRSLAYEALNRPWRLPLVLRAVRLGRARQRTVNVDLVDFWADLAAARRHDAATALLGNIPPWQRHMVEHRGNFGHLLEQAANAPDLVLSVLYPGRSNSGIMAR